MKHVFALLLLASLAACGGGDWPEEPADEAITEPTEHSNDPAKPVPVVPRES